MHLKKLNISGVYQGDLLFTDEDITRKNIDGKPHITFTPNTITYAVPENSDLAKQIDAAKVGIIFHTTYVGDTLADMNAKGGASIEEFSKNNSVFFDNASYKDVSGSAKFTDDETKMFLNELDKLETLLGNIPRNLQNLFGANKDFVPFFQIYINSMVKEGQLPTNSTQFINGFRKFYIDRMQQQISGLKAQKALALRQDKIKQMPQFLNKLKAPLQRMLSFYKQVQKMKAMILKKMNQAMAIGSFAQTENGLVVTDPEGFVAVDRLQNKALKLVDRLEFSKANFTVAKDWVKG